MSTPTTNRRVLLDSGKPERHATTPSKTPGRRVLGELATNAKVSPQKPAITSIKPQAPPSPSPRKQSRALPLPKNENASSEALRQERMTARKRSIHEVEDAVVREDAPGFPAKRVAGRADLSKSSRPPIHVRPDTTATAPTMPTINLHRASSVEGSPEPAPQNTQETTGTIASFSSLIDYTAAASPKFHTSSPPEPAGTRVKTQAETLRLRLQAALYKVKTDQIFIPLDDLDIPPKYQRKPAETNAVASPSGQQTPPHSQAEYTTATTTTTENLDASSAALKLLPAPLLRPTAYSTRFIESPTLPSSPPATGPNHDDTTPRALSAQRDTDPTTPTAARRASVPAQLSSPPGSGSTDGDEVRRAATEGELTSSVRKGRAASGLLELMRSA
ncbi:uncharacterized protein BKA78DRAFT_348200 [Phyllosticta capitalensis]|uniref:uncharacterized protein n=1 Tax=Phyllosticta capitalensis TaxID=121624 RepID=UPI00312D353D